MPHTDAHEIGEKIRQAICNLIPVVKPLVRLTPTQVDDAVVDFLQGLIDCPHVLEGTIAALRGQGKL